MGASTWTPSVGQSRRCFMAEFLAGGPSLHVSHLHPHSRGSYRQSRAASTYSEQFLLSLLKLAGAFGEELKPTTRACGRCEELLVMSSASRLHGAERRQHAHSVERCSQRFNLFAALCDNGRNATTPKSVQRIVCVCACVATHLRVQSRVS